MSERTQNKRLQRSEIAARRRGEVEEVDEEEERHLHGI